MKSNVIAGTKRAMGVEKRTEIRIVSKRTLTLLPDYMTKSL